MILGDIKRGELDTKAFYHICGTLTRIQRIFLDSACMSCFYSVVSLPVTRPILWCFHRESYPRKL